VGDGYGVPVVVVELPVSTGSVVVVTVSAELEDTVDEIVVTVSESANSTAIEFAFTPVNDIIFITVCPSALMLVPLVVMVRPALLVQDK
jgi:hypothetical protein